MPRPPYTNFPFPFYRNYPGISRNLHNVPYTSSTINKNNSTNTVGNKNTLELNSEDENNRNFKAKNKSNKYTDDYLFDLFGLKIYSDDVLLVSLIYFLYSEDVKDDGLFLVLILLLLS